MVIEVYSKLDRLKDRKKRLIITYHGFVTIDWNRLEIAEVVGHSYSANHSRSHRRAISD